MTIDDLTPEFIADLERLLAEATERPWWVDDEDKGLVKGSDDRVSHVCEMAGNPHNPTIAADRDLLMALVNAAPALIDELKRLRAEVDRVELECRTVRDNYNTLLDGYCVEVKERRALLAEFKALSVDKGDLLSGMASLRAEVATLRSNSDRDARILNSQADTISKLRAEVAEERRAASILRVTVSNREAEVAALRGALEKLVRIYESEQDTSVERPVVRPDWLRAALGPRR